jgi:hypothetical protein
MEKVKVIRNSGPALVVSLLMGIGLGPLSAEDATGPRIKAGDGHLDFLVEQQLVGRYHVEADVAKPYLWPLRDPFGQPLTRAWPMEPLQAGGSKDHVHQKSAWFCHGDVIPEGLSLAQKVKGVDGVDFWSEGAGHGRIVCKQVETPKQGNQPFVIAHNEWQTADGQTILDETRTIHLYQSGPARLLVFDIDLRASLTPIVFGDTKEGSFGIRIHDQLREVGGKGKLENADGKIGEANCWGRLSAWCDYSGPLGEHTVGLAILDDPANPYPACWHSRGYGLMAANPFGRAKSGFPAMRGKTELVRVAKAEHLKLRYGLLIHSGDARAGKVAELYQQFVKLRRR